MFHVDLIRALWYHCHSNAIARNKSNIQSFVWKLSICTRFAAWYRRISLRIDLICSLSSACDSRNGLKHCAKDDTSSSSILLKRSGDWRPYFRRVPVGFKHSGESLSSCEGGWASIATKLCCFTIGALIRVRVLILKSCSYSCKSVMESHGRTLKRYKYLWDYHVSFYKTRVKLRVYSTLWFQSFEK